MYVYIYLQRERERERERERKIRIYEYICIYIRIYISEDIYISIARISGEEGGRHTGERAKKRRAQSKIMGKKSYHSNAQIFVFEIFF